MSAGTITSVSINNSAFLNYVVLSMWYIMVLKFFCVHSFFVELQLDQRSLSVVCMKKESSIKPVVIIICQVQVLLESVELSAAIFSLVMCIYKCLVTLLILQVVKAMISHYQESKN